MIRVHTGQAVGWYRCDGDDCPLCSSLTGDPRWLPLKHWRNCPARFRDDDCTCGLDWRVELHNWFEMYKAWRKRAEEAELVEQAALCNRCRTSKKTVRVSTGFAGEEELLCGGCVADEIERLEEIIKRQP